MSNNETLRKMSSEELIKEVFSSFEEISKVVKDKSFFKNKDNYGFKAVTIDTARDSSLKILDILDILKERIKK